jgi:MOSC domain-containing protein YiiM
VGKVVHIFVAPERGLPMQAVQHVAAGPGRGLGGDRYADAKYWDQARDITLIEMENIEAFRLATGAELAADGPRRNVVTSGIRLNDLVGKRFFVGAALAEGVELCEPCRLFQSRTHGAVLPFFVGKGGLRAKIVGGGRVEVGDDIGPAA